MNLNRSHKIILAVLLAAQNFAAIAQTTNALAPADYPKFILQRNIFDPGREPNVPYVFRPKTAYVPPVVRQVDAFSLVGIIGYGEGRLAGVHAFFNGSSLQYQKAAQVDDSIAGFKITNIAADSVTLVSGTNTMVLAIGEQLHNDGIGHWLYANGSAMRYNSSSGYGSGRNSGRGGSRRRNNNSGNYNSGNFGNNNFSRVGNNFAPSTAAPGNSQADDQGMNSQDDSAAPDDNAAPGNAASSDNTNVPDTGTQESPQTGH
jgi:hypothetical protein